MTTQNNNEFLEGESNKRENFENKWNYPSEKKEFKLDRPFKWIDYNEWNRFKYGKNTIFDKGE